jgi:hypothetical protein
MCADRVVVEDSTKKSNETWSSYSVVVVVFGGDKGTYNFETPAVAVLYAIGALVVVVSREGGCQFMFCMYIYILLARIRNIVGIYVAYIIVYNVYIYSVYLCISECAPLR